MSKEYRARTFKSGNSVALRLPKAWGFDAGEEVAVVIRDDGTVEMRRAADRAALLDSLYGSMSPGFMAEGRGDIEQEDRDWGDGDRSVAA